MAGPVGNLYSTLYARPAVELSGYATRYGLKGLLVAYLNYGGATGSAKDALAEGMLALAVERGALAPGQPVVEASSGTFAVGLIVAAKRSGHPVHLVVQGNVDPARQRYLAELGAAVSVTNYVYGRAGARKKALAVAEETGGYFVDYFENSDNPEYHRRVTGPAVLRAMDGEVDAFIAGVGSAGTLTGAGEYLKGWAGNVWNVAVQPFESQSLTGGMAGRHGIAGIGPGFLPPHYNPYAVDEVISVTTVDAKEAARDVLDTDGVPASISCGAVLAAAKQVMQRRPMRVLCMFNGMQLYE